MSRYFIDEFPQIINFLKGDLCLVGIRPETLNEFGDYPEQVKKQYLRYGPGAIGINYGFSGTPTEDDPQCEKARTDFILHFYQEYGANKWFATLKYGWKSISAILFKGRRGI